MNKILFILSLSLGVFSLSAHGARIYVDSSHVSGIQNGVSWTTAFSDLQDGIDAAVAGDSIWVAKGTYLPVANSSFILKPGIRVFGGFLNTNTIFAQRDWATNISLLKGNGNSVIQNNGNNTMLRTYLDGFSITRGSGNKINNNCFGGGIYSTAPLEIDNCNINRNAVVTASSNYIGKVFGGGIYSAANLIINNSIITADSAKTLAYSSSVKSFGGGIYSADSLQINNSTISGNYMLSDTSRGSGIYNAGVTIDSNCNISGNYGISTSTFSSTYGGGIFNAGTLSVIGGTISNNTVSSSVTTTASASHGGGVFNQGTAIFTDSCIIVKNTAFNGGGIYSTGSLSIENCKVDSNKAWEFGGGITSRSYAFITGTSFSYNTIPAYYWSYGGGVYNLDTLVMSNCTIKGNFISSSNYYASGAGFCNGKKATLTNCVIAGNKDTATYGSYGGGICNYGTLQLDSTQVFQNISTNHYNSSVGGGIYSKSAGLSGTYCFVTNNQSDNGGGIFVDSVQVAGTNLKIDRFTFIANKARLSGGAVFNKTLPAGSAISNCIFNRDSADNGGAVYNLKSSPNMVNNLFSRNVADVFGAAIYNKQSSPKIINNTIALNVSKVDAAGLYNVTNANPVINNSIIWGNSSGIVNGTASGTTVYYSIVQDMPANAANHILNGNTNPLFTDTVGIGNYQLQSGSPCINMGNITALPTGYTTDITMHPRISGSSVDMGAYEVPLMPLVNLGNDTALCAGNTLVLDVQNYDCTYSWNTGDTTRTLAVSSSGIYIVTATNSLGSSTDTISITFNPNPVVDLGSDTTVSANAYVLDAANTGDAYLWSTGATTQTITVTTTGTYSVTVTNASNCSASDTINVTFRPTGIDEITQNGNNVVISPNPLTVSASIDISKAPHLLGTLATITDITGKTVKIFRIESKNQIISLADISNGIYFLRMYDGRSFKVVKQ